VSQVVHDYGDVCQVITELAVETDAPIDARDFRMLNGCLDDAIAIAVTQFAREGYQAAVDEENARGGERLGFLAHELRNLLNTAVLAFDVLKTGNVGVAGSTGAILQRSLVMASDLIARSLAEVRLAQGVHKPERFEVAPFIDEVATASKLAADARRVELKVAPVAAGLAIEADRQLLSAVVTNLLQNAFKFTRPETAVSLRVDASAERVLIEIQDACGGLPAGDVEGIFRPFEQRSEDRSGLGLGLAFSRWGIKASHGRLYARDLPTVGCVFTVDLPRLPAPAVALS
jgi:signal transduction histidine kinase